MAEIRCPNCGGPRGGDFSAPCPHCKSQNFLNNYLYPYELRGLRIAGGIIVFIIAGAVLMGLMFALSIR